MPTLADRTDSDSPFAHDHVARVRAEHRWRPSDLRELWAYRELLWVLARRDVRVRYRQTLLGIGWAVVRPVMTMVVFSVVFGRLVGVPSEGYPYPVFVFAGLLPWSFFAATVAAAGGSLRSSAGLVSKVYFPRLILPLSTVGAALVDLAISCAILLGLMLYFGVPITSSLLAAPAMVALLAVTAVAAGIFVAAISVNYRDAQHLLPFVLQVWMFVSPIIYPVAVVPERWRWVLFLNPLTGLIEGFRSAFLGKPFEIVPVAMAAVVALPALAAAVVIFARSERRFADLI